MGFDFAGVYTRIVEHELIGYAFGGRTARVEFVPGPKGVGMRITFDSEPTHCLEQQRSGWRAIFDNFARRVVDERHWRIARSGGGGPYRIQLGEALLQVPEPVLCDLGRRRE